MSTASLFYRLAREADDATLLARYGHDRDETAFAELVRRHGGLVLGVCRRVLGDATLADDAFQATFVVLARKAGDVRPGKLPNWLHSVAHKVALRARTMAGRRAKREAVLTESLDPAGPERPAIEADETAAIVDAEIAALPERLRTAVILCELQGVGRRAAAQRLGIAEGTLSSRLATARKTLAERLRHRGLALSTGVLAATLVPAALGTATVQAAVRGATNGLVSNLVEGVVRTMLLRKLQAVPVVLLAGVLAIVGTQIGQPIQESASAAPAVKAAAKSDDGLIWLHNIKAGKLIALSAGGATVLEVPLPEGKNFLGLTPEGDRIMFVGKNGKPAAAGAQGLTLHFRGIRDGAIKDTQVPWAADDYFVWSPDGKSLVRGRANRAADGKTRLLHSEFDLATAKEKEIVLPVEQPAQLRHWSADGKSWIVLDYNLGQNPALPEYRWFRVSVAGGGPTPIVDSHSFLRLEPSPDGTTLVGSGQPHPSVVNDRSDFGYFSVSLKDGTVTRLTQDSRPWDAVLKWSPAGKRLASIRYYAEGKSPELYVSNGDCKNERKVLTLANANNEVALLGWLPSQDIPRPVERKKLERVPEPPTELQKHLARMDDEYRHGSPEKFRDLEKLAAELTNVFPDADDVARIWGQVAFVAGQSGIDKHAERVRTYAIKCLAVSRDPIQRGLMYSYLASAATIAEPEFAKGRREAAGHLLRGYHELLRQELPASAPELPGVGRFDVDGPEAAQARALHAAQMAAREEARFIRDQVARRDILVQQLRDLYKPDPKQHGHTAEAVEELRAMAAKQMAPKQVEALIRLVTADGDEKKALEAVERLGGQVLRQDNKPDTPVYSATVLGKAVADADLEDLLGFTALGWLTLNDTRVTDAGLKTVARFPNLYAVSLIGTAITDDGLKNLAPLKGLTYLNLANTKIGDAGGKTLAQHPKLATLLLDKTAVTDAGLKAIAEIKSLTTLTLAETAITDDGLREIARLSNLLQVTLRDCKVTEAGVAELQKALPKCTIRR